MEELQARHRKEQRDLQSRITQKKKQANKKNRKGVNDECARLEEELRTRQEQEIAGQNGDLADDGSEAVDEETEEVKVPSEQLQNLHLANGNEKSSRDNANGNDEADSAAQDIPHSNGPAKKRNRAKDRLARRAAEQEDLVRQAKEEAFEISDLKQQERERMLEAMNTRGLREKEIRADGHCLYSAVADQLEQLDIPLLDPSTTEEDHLADQPPYKRIRAAAAEYIAAHPDDFVPFLEEPLDQYLHKIRATGEWGGQLELLALARTYRVDINVLQDFGRIEKIDAGSSGGSGANKSMWVSYYKHGFGLGEHYNSLRHG